MFKQSLLIAASLFSMTVTAQDSQDMNAYLTIKEVTVTPGKVQTISRRAFANAAIGMGACSAAAAGNSNATLSNRSLFLSTHTGQPTNSATTTPSDAQPSVRDTATAVLTDEVLQPLTVLDAALDKIINIGKKAWSVVEAGKPVVNLNMDVATALPEGARCWTDLQAWQTPKAATYTVSYKNAYNIEVVRFSYRVLYITGGNVNGKGAYIGYAAIQPADVLVRWGFNLQVQGNTLAVYNMGTKEAPVAGMALGVNYSVDTVINHMSGSKTFSIPGNGDFVAQ